MEVSEGEYSSIYDIKRELHDELLLAENCENGDDGINYVALKKLRVEIR